MKREIAIQKAVELYPDIDEDVIKEIAKLFPMYSGEEICYLARDLYWAIVYDDPMFGTEGWKRKEEERIEEAIKLALESKKS